jgi:hypothetical protein
VAEYFGVPAPIYEELMKASSHGSYFIENVKDIYEYVRIR